MDSELLFLLSQEQVESSAGRYTQAATQSSLTNSTVINFGSSAATSNFTRGSVTSGTYGLTVLPGVYYIAGSLSLTLTGAFSGGGYAQYQVGLATITSGGAVDQVLSSRSTVWLSAMANNPTVIDLSVSTIYDTTTISPTVSKTVGLIYYVSSSSTVPTATTNSGRTSISVSSV